MLFLPSYLYANSTKSSMLSIEEETFHVYIEGLAGYNRFAFSDTKPSTIGWDNGNGNFSFGASFGIKTDDRYISAELGGIYTLAAKATDNSTARRFTKAKVQPWYAYFALVLSIPISNHINLLTKAGPGYQQCNDDANNVIIRKWGAMFSAGIAYFFNPAFYINGQWLRFTGEIKNNEVQTTAPNIFLLGLGYKFTM
jgi:hypothetical protein